MCSILFMREKSECTKNLDQSMYGIDANFYPKIIGSSTSDVILNILLLC